MKCAFACQPRSIYRKRTDGRRIAVICQYKYKRDGTNTN